METSKKALLRIALLSSAILVLAGVGISLILTSPADEELVRERIDSVILGLETNRLPPISSSIRFPFLIILNGERDIHDEEGLKARLNIVTQSYQFIDIRLQSIEMWERGSNEMRVEVKFHWTVARLSNPRIRYRSENENEGGEPEVARLIFEKKDDGWRADAMELRLQ